MKNTVIVNLTTSDNKQAYAYMQKIVLESTKTNKWYKYFDEFYSLLNHPKSLVRNRAIEILTAICKWDEENKFDSIIDEYLLHVNDENAITVRKCIQNLVLVGKAKPKLISKILKALKKVDTSKHKDSMKSLIENDIKKTVNELKAYEK